MSKFDVALLTHIELTEALPHPVRALGDTAVASSASYRNTTRASDPGRHYLYLRFPMRAAAVAALQLSNSTPLHSEEFCSLTIDVLDHNQNY